MKKKLLAIILCLALALTFAACGGGGDTPEGDSGDVSQPDNSAAEKPAVVDPTKDTLNIAVYSDEGTLDIRFMTTGLHAAMTTVYEPLWDVTEKQETIMVLAESVDEVSETEYTVHLRKDVKFSNGNPFTAEDIVFSVGVYNDAGATGQPRVQVIDPAKTEAIDDNTLKLVLLSPSVAFWQILSQFCIYDKESFDEKSLTLNPIGTGPYKLTEYVPNSVAKLERRDDYWGTAPDIKYLNFSVLAEPSQRVNALDTGHVDTAEVATDDAEYVKGLANYNLEQRYSGNYRILGFNFGSKSIFKDNLDARRAVVHAIDPQVIVDVVFSGQGEVMHAAVPDICFDYEDRFTDMDDTYKLGQDLELAKQLAESSGIAGKTLRLMTDGTTEAVKTAEIVQDMVNQIGVKVDIQNFDPATAWQMIYDPEADVDFSIGRGICPNRVVGDQLYNGVRFIPPMIAPGAFEGNEEYLKKAPLVMSTLDKAKNSELLFELLGQYEANVLTFALCNTLISNAYATTIDMSSVSYSVGTGWARFQDFKFAK